MFYRLFLEGDYDSAFIKAYLNHIFNNNIPDNIEFIVTNGWTLLTLNANFFKENTDRGGRNLVIYDADFEHNHGGFNDRREEILRIKEEQEIEFELFLFPNNQLDGDLETLLSQIVSEQHRPIMECFNDYEACLRKQAELKPEVGYRLLHLKKVKIFAYMETFLKKKVITVAQDNNHWFFDNSTYWDLNSIHLNALKQFLIENLQ